MTAEEKLETEPAAPASEGPPRRGSVPVRILLAAAKVALLLLCLAAGIFTIAAFFAKRYWIFDNATAFRLHCYAVLLLGGLTYLGRRKYKTGAVLIVLAFANIPAITPLYSGGDPKVEEPGKTYRIVWFNIWEHNPHPDRVLEYLASSHADVIVLTEVNKDWRKTLEPLEEEHGYKLFYDMPNAVYSRLPLGNVSRDLVERRALFQIVLFADGAPLTLFSGHPHSPVSARAAEKRNIFLAGLAERASAIENEMIILGDLNVASYSPYFRDLVADSGLRDARSGFGVRPSWPGFLGILGVPIDQCLVSDGIIVRAFALGPRSGSDHRPIAIDFSLK